MKNKANIYLLLVLFLASSCAQIGNLTGGEKDTKPPVFKSSIPEFAGTNFKDDKIILTFDEFFVLDNLNSVFLSSPPLTEKPDFIIKKKSLIIKLNDKLKDSATYSFYFGDAIKDFTEGNKLKNFKFVFSTGNEIDTLEAGGKITDAITHTALQDMYIFLYKNHSDSVPLKEKPYYIAKSDSSGNFKFDYIGAGKYKIFALKDNDANLIFNLPNEKIAFIDSLIIPEVETETKVDSLKAGTILHKGEKDTAGDTLQKDTVIITTKYNYSPQNILLFAFTEDKNQQYISDAKRELPGKCIFKFGKKTDDLTFSGANFSLSKKDYFTEKQDTGKTLVIWLKNKDLYLKDSLTFIAKYFNKDSLGKFNEVKDSILLSYDFSKDTIRHFVTFKEEKNKYADISNKYIFETEIPVKTIDTSKIKLFEIIDTLVNDTREQKLTEYSRPAPDTLLFKIKRPFQNHFYPEPLNFDSVLNWCFTEYNEDSTFLSCVIKDEDISKKDTLKVALKYDNKYFRGQVQKFSDTLILPLLKQKLLSVKRPSPDTLIFQFIKRCSAKTEISDAENNKNKWYEKVKTDDNKKLILKITDKYFVEEDTLLLKIRTEDYDNTEGNKIWFEFVKPAVFKFKKQKITKAYRPAKNKFNIIFNKPLIKDIKIKDLKYNNNAFEISYNPKKDTVSINVTNSETAQNDTLKIAVLYYDKRKRKQIETTDTLTLLYKRHRRRHHRKSTSGTSNPNQNKQNNVIGGDTISIEISKTFKIIKDSANERKLMIISDFKPGFSYVLKTDSFAFQDYYGNFSKFQKFDFNVRKEDDYGKITLNIKNIKRISDELFYFKTDTLISDSASYSVLDEGQLIIKLFDEKDNLIKEEYLKKDTVISYQNMIPGKYHLKMIYDSNENKHWDTGNYLKHIQPERIFYYPDDIIIKPGWDNAIDIKFNPAKLK